MPEITLSCELQGILCFSNRIIQICCIGTSLVVHWLRLRSQHRVLQFDPRASQTVLVKNPPASAGDIKHSVGNQSLGREDPLEEEMVTHSSILAWRIPWTEEPGGLQSMGSQRVRHDPPVNAGK